MRLIFGSKPKPKPNDNKAEFYEEALKKGREIRPLASTGIGDKYYGSTCAIGAIALGLGFRNRDFTTTEICEFMDKNYPDFPSQKVIVVSDGTIYGEKDNKVIDYLHEFYG